MKLIDSATAYYPSFLIGMEPTAVECQLSILEANGRKYLKTPFAMLDAHGDDINRAIDGRSYFATESECMSDLNYRYPNWSAAGPIMESLFNSKRHCGDIVGPARIADQCGVSVDAIHQLARGARRFTLKQVKQAVKALAAVNV